jgi:hypothetical protein
MFPRGRRRRRGTRGAQSIVPLLRGAHWESKILRRVLSLRSGEVLWQRVGFCLNATLPVQHRDCAEALVFSQTERSGDVMAGMKAKFGDVWAALPRGYIFRKWLLPQLGVLAALAAAQVFEDAPLS